MIKNLINVALIGMLFTVAAQASISDDYNRYLGCFVGLSGYLQRTTPDKLDAASMQQVSDVCGMQVNHPKVKAILDKELEMFIKSLSSGPVI